MKISWVDKVRHADVNEKKSMWIVLQRRRGVTLLDKGCYEISYRRPNRGKHVCVGKLKLEYISQIKQNV